MNFNNLTAKHVGEIMMSALQEDSPSTFFKNIISDPANKKFFKEFFDMTNIPAGPTSEHHPAGELYDILNDLKNIFKMGDWHFDGLNVKCNFAKENVAYSLVAELEGNSNALVVNPS